MVKSNVAANWGSPSMDLLGRIAALEQEKEALKDETRFLRRRTSALEDENKEYQLDDLTGVYVRKAFSRKVDEMLTKAKEKGTDVGYLLIDFDDFKPVNTKYTQAGGDQMLTHVANVLRKNIRAYTNNPNQERRRGSLDGANDLVGIINEESVEIGRVGGDEFAVALYGVTATQAYDIAERLRQAVANSPCTINGDTVYLTMSIGVATTAVTEATHDDLYGCAATALDSAKKGNERKKNCTFLSSRHGQESVAHPSRVRMTDDSAHTSNKYALAS